MGRQGHARAPNVKDGGKGYPHGDTDGQIGRDGEGSHQLNFEFYSVGGVNYHGCEVLLV